MLNNRFFRFFIFFLLIPVWAESRSIKILSYGITRATFRETEGEISHLGTYYGLGLEYSKPKSILFGLDLGIASKKIILKNKTWPNSYYQDQVTAAIVGDIDASSLFWELSLKFGYILPILNEDFSISFFLGPILSSRFKYTGSVTSNASFYLTPEERGIFTFDYGLGDADGTIPDLCLDMSCGFDLRYKRASFETRYARARHERKYIGDLSLHDKFDTLYLIVRFGF